MLKIPGFLMLLSRRNTSPFDAELQRIVGLSAAEQEQEARLLLDEYGEPLPDSQRLLCDISSLANFGFYNKQLYDFLEKCVALKLNNSSSVVSAHLFKIVKSAEASWLIIGEDFGGEFLHGIKAGDQGSIYELHTETYEPEVLGASFYEFVLIMYAVERFS